MKLNIKLTSYHSALSEILCTSGKAHPRIIFSCSKTVWNHFVEIVKHKLMNFQLYTSAKTNDQLIVVFFETFRVRDEIIYIAC